jgi:membrane-associated protein
MPFIRTFAPFVAGVAHMRYSVFAFYNIAGGILWVCSLTGLGFLIGENAWVKSNFSLVALAMIIIPGLPALWIFIKEVLKKLQARSK